MVLEIGYTYIDVDDLINKFGRRSKKFQCCTSLQTMELQQYLKKIIHLINASRGMQECF